MNLNIRPFKKEDSKSLSELYSQEWETEITEEALDKFLSNNNFLFI